MVGSGFRNIDSAGSPRGAQLLAVSGTFACSALATGFVLTVLGTTICVMWPYTKVLHANIREPALASCTT